MRECQCADDNDDQETRPRRHTSFINLHRDMYTGEVHGHLLLELIAVLEARVIIKYLFGSDVINIVDLKHANIIYMLPSKLDTRVEEGRMDSLK